MQLHKPVCLRGPYEASHMLIQTLTKCLHPLVPRLSSGSRPILKQFLQLATILPGSVPRVWPASALCLCQAWFHLCQNSFHQNCGLLFRTAFTVLKSEKILKESKGHSPHLHVLAHVQPNSKPFLHIELSSSFFISSLADMARLTGPIIC